MSKPFEADVIDNFSPALRLLNDRVKKIAGQINVGVKNDQTDFWIIHSLFCFRWSVGLCQYTHRIAKIA